MREFACNCPNCDGRREIRRNKIVCPFCDSEWILVDNELIEIIEEKPIEKPTQLKEEEYADESWLGIASALIGAILVIACIIIPILI